MQQESCRLALAVTLRVRTLVMLVHDSVPLGQLNRVGRFGQAPR